MSPRCLAPVLLALLGALTVPARSQSALAPTTSPGPEWTTERWTTANGLPQNSVTSIAQDRTGMLWLTTFGGLVQFDGLHMRVTSVVTDARLGTNRLLAVHATDDGTLYLGTEGHGLRAIRGQDLLEIGGAAGVSTLTVMRICGGRNGELWLATQRGIARMQDDRIAFPWPEVTANMVDVAVGADGLVYSAASNGVWRLGADPPRHWPNPPVLSLAIGPGGEVFAGTNTQLLLVTEAGLVQCGPARNRVLDLAIDRNGGLLVLDDTGIRERSLNAETPETTAPIRVESTGRCLWEDRDGRLWVGHDGHGLTCCRPTQLHALGLGNATLVAPDPDGGFFYGNRGLVWHMAKSGAKRLLLRQPAEVFAMASAGQDGVWLGTGSTVHHLAPSGAIETICELPPDQVVWALAADRDGGLLVGTDRGTIASVQGGALRILQSPEPQQSAVHCFLRTRDALWVGTANGARRSTDNGATWRELRAGFDIAAGEVRGIAADRTGAIWIGSYGGGITCWRDDRARIITRRDGLPSDAICQLEIDRERDQLLINTNAGVCRSLMADMRAFAFGETPATMCTLLASPADVNVEGNGFKWPSSCRLADGTYVFCSIDDVVALAPEATEAPIRVLHASIEEVRFGSPRHDDDASDLKRHAYVRFTAPAFENASFVTFRHRLHGLDPDWVQDGHERSAEYFDLPPGNYRFEVAATGPGTAWGPSAMIEFSVPRAWHEMPIAWIGGMLLTLGAIVGVARFASRRQSFRNQLLEAAVRSRTAELQGEISRRQTAESRLQAAHDDLERRVSLRTAELRRAVTQLETDAEERASLEQQIDRLQRLDSIGRLAGGIAHDFNNLLTVVISSAELLRSTAPGDLTARDLVDSIERAGHQGSRLTQQLLTFARRQSVRPEVLDLGELVRSSAQMLRRVVPASIDFESRIADEPIVIEADRAQIEQVLLNLCVNARDAMPKGGHLTIALVKQADPAGTCELQIIDDGVGMTKETADRAFEPFFSTKHRATNSGLGLSTCYGIVKRLDGDLRIESAPGQGTKVSVVLPCTNKPLESPILTLPRPQSLNGTALMIEDNDDVRRSFTLLLQQQGCRVEQAASGDAALALLDGGLRFDFVVSDLVMPGLQGQDLAQALARRRPDLPIVFVSGDPDAGSAALRELGFEVLQKPPDRADLVAAILRARRLAEAVDRGANRTAPSAGT